MCRSRLENACVFETKESDGTGTVPATVQCRSVVPTEDRAAIRRIALSFGTNEQQ